MSKGKRNGGAKTLPEVEGNPDESAPIAEQHEAGIASVNAEFEAAMARIAEIAQEGSRAILAELGGHDGNPDEEESNNA